MKQVFQFDSSGFFVCPIILKNNELIPADCTEVQPIDGLYKAKLIDGKWVEGLSQEEIDVILNVSNPKSEIDVLKENQLLIQQALDDIILGGAL